MTEENKTRVVKCPEMFAPLFAEAEQVMETFFTGLERRPEEGDIQISGVRYLLMRTDGISSRFSLSDFAGPTVQLIADAVLERHGKDHDDATCVVIGIRRD